MTSTTFCLLQMFIDTLTSLFKVLTHCEQNLFLELLDNATFHIGSNFHSVKKRLLLFCSRVRAKRRTAGPLTNQNDVGMSITCWPHLKHGALWCSRSVGSGSFFLCCENVESVDTAVPSNCLTDILMFWWNFTGWNYSSWMVVLNSPISNNNIGRRLFFFFFYSTYHQEFITWGCHHILFFSPLAQKKKRQTFFC